MSLDVNKAADLAPYLGQELGASEWVEIAQDRINQFAEATGDHQWIHVDVERARREMPGGKTIAHGFLTLSLTAGLGSQVMRITGQSRSLNYGLNKVRFMSPVPVGSRVRLKQKLLTLEPVPGGQRVIVEAILEIEGQSKAALVAESIRISYD